MKKNVLFGALLIGFIFSVFGQNVTDFEYINKNNSITITGYTGNAKDVVIPETINGLPVTVIGNSALTRCRLTSVTFPGTITVIEDYAFSYNNLKNINLPVSLVTVGYMAFSKNRLVSLTIPESVVSIGMYAFSENKISSVTLPMSIEYLGDGSFTRNYLKEIVVPVTVRSFNSYVFDKYVKISRR